MTIGILCGLLLLAVLALSARVVAFIPGPPDAELVLQGSVTKTADFESEWLNLGAAFAPGGLGMPVAGVIGITAITVDGAGEISAKLQECPPDPAADGDPDETAIADIGASLVLTATGLAVVKGFVTTRYVRLRMDVAGGTSTITYSANLNP